MKYYYNVSHAAMIFDIQCEKNVGHRVDLDFLLTES